MSLELERVLRKEKEVSSAVPLSLPSPTHLVHQDLPAQHLLQSRQPSFTRLASSPPSCYPQLDAIRLSREPAVRDDADESAFLLFKVSESSRLLEDELLERGAGEEEDEAFEHGVEEILRRDEEEATALRIERLAFVVIQKQASAYLLVPLILPRWLSSVEEEGEACARLERLGDGSTRVAGAR